MPGHAHERILVDPAEKEKANPSSNEWVTRILSTSLKMDPVTNNWRGCKNPIHLGLPDVDTLG